MNDKTDLAELVSHQKSQATNAILQSKRKSPAQVPTISQEKNKAEEPLVESDMLYLYGQEISIGTRIKRNALELFKLHHNELQQISLRKRKKISNSLSSILDSVDQSFNSQRTLFKPDEWRFLNNYFDDKYNPVPVALNDDITDVITIISNILNLAGNFKASLAYIRGMQDNDFPNIKAIVTHLLAMKRDLNAIVNKLSERSDAISTPGSLNREERRHTNEKFTWIRNTWHTPPPETMPKVPALLYARPDASLYDRIIIDDPTNIAESSKSATDNYIGTPDSHGWASTADGNIYNIHPKQTRDEHPLDKEN